MHENGRVKLNDVVSQYFALYKTSIACRDNKRWMMNEWMNEWMIVRMRALHFYNKHGHVLCVSENKFAVDWLV